MPRVKIRENQLTLPDELRRVLSSASEDELDAELVEDGVLLKPSREARRRAALADIRAAQAGVRYVGPGPRPSPEVEEEMIAELVEAEKAEKATARKHG